MDELFDEICNYIVKTVKTKSNHDMSGFQYVVDYSDIYEKFNNEINIAINSNIESKLSSMKEVADVVCDIDGFDVVLYTDYSNK